jgi:hypothetical protein
LQSVPKLEQKSRSNAVILEKTDMLKIMQHISLKLQCYSPQWKIISITSMECGLLGSETHGSENSHAIEVNCLNICQKQLNFIQKCCKIDVKAAENQNFPAFIFHYTAETTFYQNNATLQMSLEVFQCKNI